MGWEDPMRCCAPSSNHPGGDCLCELRGVGVQGPAAILRQLPEGRQEPEVDTAPGKELQAPARPLGLLPRLLLRCVPACSGLCGIQELLTRARGYVKRAGGN